MTVTIDGTNGITTPSPVVVQGSTSGSITLAAPAVAGSNTATLPAGTGTVAVQGASTNIVSGTAVASTSGTSIDFTSIPSWVKRITVMLSGVSTSGSSNYQIQIGSGSVTTSGYNSTATRTASTVLQTTTATSGFLVNVVNANNSVFGAYVISLVSGFSYVQQGNGSDATNAANYFSAGGVTLGGTLDRVRITTVNGTDTFDAGSINILYE